MSLAQYSKEELQEFSLMEMAYEYLKNSKQPIAFNELVEEIKKASGISDDEVRTRLAQFYTDINVDGRFLSLGSNRWGLRVWYPVDTAEEEVVAVVKPKKKKAKKVVDEDDLEDFDEVDEIEDDFDDFDDEDDLLDDDDDDLDLDEDDDLDLDDDDDAIEDDLDIELDEEDDLDDDLEDEEEEFDDEEEVEED
ncbi:DNA-directed RNA polymerase subunit delta [Neobacillus sp. SuZ13]|uniref:DNA-directed RNA polymerase subunit delta n=1 Tax=Neobacillus sp. SuZ13 TaxID=3047875 RepID=UPI0024C0742F|nr:DNA-directed RNA polymerase subunit delta [Neobacillus sp. SuZ13]WHY66988.1 DNA-directed RNA polymerase subunit delta [Neobacillus sp. SuZ13]